MLTSKETIAKICESGVAKASLSLTQTLILATLAGAYISIGSHLFTTVLAQGLPRLVASLTFSLGLILVVVAGAELFTGNTLMAGSVLARKISWSALARNWLLVYGGNFLGSIIIASLIFSAGVNGNSHTLSPIGKTALSIAQAKANLPIIQIVARGILANWLVCLAIYLATTASSLTGKVVGIIFPITAFVTMNFEHSVANMYFLTAGKFLSPSLAIGPMAVNLLFATLGNIVGSVTFVVLPYWHTHLKNCAVNS